MLLSHAPVTDELLPLAHHLRVLGLRTRVDAPRHAGVPDVRLCVRATEHGPLVEVLARDPDWPAPDCWHAVRVHDGSRHVWRGPSGSSPLAEVGAFVEVLTRPVLDQHALRYDDLG